jgi:expansin (peptidoglycan-binding protein)
MPRTDDDYFVAEAGLGAGPFTLRVTDVYGHEVEDTGIPLGDDSVSPGASQLEACP